MNKDYYGKDASSLNNKRLFLFDMDGTIYNDNEIFDGTIDLLNTIKNNDGKFIFITNNSSKSSKAYVKKLKEMGIDVTCEDIFSSIDATIFMLKKDYPNVLVYVQGTKSFLEELKDNGIKVTEKIDSDIGLVLTGFDTELNFDKLNKTCEILTKNDVPYYATNPDLVCPVNYGFVPDNGSVAIMIKNATGKSPIYIGKPEPTMINLVCEKFGYDKKDAILIGDRLYTDIACGINSKVDTICVLSGETTLADLETTEYKPTYVIENVRAINNILIK